MQLRYGNFTHDDGTVSFSTSAQALRAQSGIPYGYVERWNISGILLADSSLTDATAMIANIATKVARLQVAYKQTGVDVEMIGTNHRIRHADTMNGVHVIVPPSFPIGENAEHVTYRSYQVVLEAEVIYRPGQPVFLSYEEHIQRWGGGPAYVRTQPLTGRPRRLIARQNTDYMAKQSGFAVAYLTTPQAPPPYWPDYLLEQNPRLDSGRSMRPNERSISWEYIYASDRPIGGGNVPSFSIPNIG